MQNLHYSSIHCSALCDYRRNETESETKSLFPVQYGEEGIPLAQLRERLMLHGVTKHMPEGKMYQVMKNADTNRDRHLAYDEFVTVV